MEQEQATMNVSLEEPSEIVGQAPAAEVPPEPEVPAAAAPEGEEADTIAASNGEVYVPLKAVKAERERRKEAERKALELEPLKEKAQRYDEAKSYLEQARPYIEKARADLHRPPPQPAAPAVDPALEQYAKDFDLFTAEGKPDVDRASRIMRFHDERAARTAQQYVAPIIQNEANRTAQGLYQQYVSRPEVNGIKIDGKLLAEAFNMVGPELIAQNPAVAEVLYQNTIARQFLSGQKPTVVPPAVLPTESIGGSGTPEERLTAVSERFRQATDMKPEQYKEVRSRYKPGQPNSLE